MLPNILTMDIADSCCSAAVHSQNLFDWSSTLQSEGGRSILKLIMTFFHTESQLPASTVFQGSYLGPLLGSPAIRIAEMPKDGNHHVPRWLPRACGNFVVLIPARAKSVILRLLFTNQAFKQPTALVIQYRLHFDNVCTFG